MHYYGISRTDIEEAIKESRKKVEEIGIDYSIYFIERDYSIYSEFPKLLSESRMVVDEIIREKRYQ